MEIHNFTYEFLKPKINAYFSNKLGSLIINSKFITLKEFAQVHSSDIQKMELEYKPLLYKLYNELKAECSNYEIYVIIDFVKWSRMIEYLAYIKKESIKMPFTAIIEEIADLHYQCLREDKLRVTGWL